MTAPTAGPNSNQRGLRNHIGHRHRTWNTTVDPDTDSPWRR